MPKLSNSVLYLMSVSAGLVVANLYYNQPLLHLISVSFNVTESAASNVALSSQLGYAVGLLIIIPLGDKVSNKKILAYDFAILILALLAAALSTSLTLLIISSFVIGFGAVIPQLFVPMAAKLSDEKNRGRAIGIVMSGLLIGILGSRAISGFVGEYLSWQAMFYIAAAMMTILYIILYYKLPKIEPSYDGTYADLWKSLGYYFRTEPTVRIAALRGGLGFAGISAFWTTLVFLMEDSFGYGSDVAGAFGLIGVVGALAAAYTGKLNDRMSGSKIIYYSAICLIISWIVFFFSGASIVGLIIGVILIDLGAQALHITNQNIIFSKNPDARNRVNTIYMVSFFMGGALGTLLAGTAWEHYGWTGVSTLGLILSIAIVVVHALFSRKAV